MGRREVGELGHSSISRLGDEEEQPSGLTMTGLCSHRTHAVRKLHWPQHVKQPGWEQDLPQEDPSAGSCDTVHRPETWACEGSLPGTMSLTGESKNTHKQPTSWGEI